MGCVSFRTYENKSFATVELRSLLQRKLRGTKTSYASATLHNGDIQIYNLNTFEIVSTLPTNDSKANCLFNENQIVVADASSLIIYDMYSLAQVNEILHKLSEIRSLLVQGKYVLANNGSSSVGVWDTKKNTYKLIEMKNNVDVNLLDDAHFYTCSDYSILIWNIQTGENVEQIPIPSNDVFSASVMGNEFVVTTPKGYHIVDRKTSAVIERVDVIKDTREVFTLRNVTNNYALLVVECGVTEDLLLWNMKTKSTENAKFGIASAQSYKPFVSKGSIVVYFSADGVSVFDVETMLLLNVFKESFDRRIDLSIK